MSREPQDKALRRKSCCNYCTMGDHMKMGKRRVRRAWKNALAQEAKRG